MKKESRYLEEEQISDYYHDVDKQKMVDGYIVKFSDLTRRKVPKVDVFVTSHIYELGLAWYPDGGKAEIILNERQPILRQKIVAAHEAAHIFLGEHGCRGRGDLQKQVIALFEKYQDRPHKINYRILSNLLNAIYEDELMSESFASFAEHDVTNKILARSTVFSKYYIFRRLMFGESYRKEIIDEGYGLLKRFQYRNEKEKIRTELNGIYGQIGTLGSDVGTDLGDSLVAGGFNNYDFYLNNTPKQFYRKIISEAKIARDFGDFIRRINLA